MYVRMEYLGFEVHFGWHDWVLRSESDLHEKNMFGVGCICRALDECLPAEQVILVEHEQEFIELSFGSFDCFLH